MENTMKIQILGTGCAKCGRLFEAAQQAVKDAGVPATVEKVTDISQILEFTAWALPALAIDGVVKAAGHVPTVAEIKAMLPKA
jgi:small redox-active disulfide protein 2